MHQRKGFTLIELLVVTPRPIQQVQGRPEELEGRQARGKSPHGFTLIELLVVIAIIAILSVVVVLTLNPAEMLRRSRDSNRLSDMTTLSTAISHFQTDQGIISGSGSMGNANTVYVSLPDPAASTSAGNNCSSLGLLTLPTGYVYHCAGPNYYRKADGTGWIPVNFSSITTGSPLGTLPIDPINSSSSRLYYTYTTNGSQFEATAPMESQNYGLGGANDQISNDGGTLASVYEKGSKLGLEPLDYGDTSLVGLWTMDEGTGTTAYDYSGNNASAWLAPLPERVAILAGQDRALCGEVSMGPIIRSLFRTKVISTLD